MELTVVIASIDSEYSLDQCLQHLTRACAGIESECIVVDAASYPAGTLTPALWAEGYRRSSGRVVAFTTSHCLVSPEWAHALLRALDDGATGAGGPLVIGPHTWPLDWAIFYLRYAGSMPHTLGSGVIAGDIAGDNAAYTRAALDQHANTFAHGFWEVDFHRLVRADGGRIVAVPTSVITFGRSFRFSTIFSHRFAHGRQFGAGRVRGRSRTVWQIAGAAPLVPFILAMRAARRAIGGPAPWKFVVALPWFLALAGAWAAGEAWGALECLKGSHA